MRRRPTNPFSVAHVTTCDTTLGKPASLTPSLPHTHWSSLKSCIPHTQPPSHYECMRRRPTNPFSVAHATTCVTTLGRHPSHPSLTVSVTHSVRHTQCLSHTVSVTHCVSPQGTHALLRHCLKREYWKLFCPLNCSQNPRSLSDISLHHTSDYE